jgi:Autotransporter beta-domain
MLENHVLVHLRISKSVGIAALLSLIGFSAQAQGTIFCPATIDGVTGFQLVNGLCTNGQNGAFSTAALSSQALGDIQQSVTQQTTTAALDAISARRKEETERCPEGFERSNDGTCRRIVVFAPAPRVSSSVPSQRRQKTPAPMMPVKAPPIVVDQGWRLGVWAHGFGDYERRTDSGTSILSGTVGGFNPNGLSQTLAIDLTQTARTGGVIGGVDVTFRNLFGGNDGLIVGILSGYISTDISLSGTSRPTAPINDTSVGIGTSTGKIRVSGPSVGGYYTYFNGAFSNDTTLKADFLSIDESFTESMPFNNNNNGFGGVNHLVSGAGSANVTNFVAAQNFQYRFPISAGLWFEPTAGYRYVNSHYDAGGAALGLQDGYDWRVQGGGRLGIESFWNAVHVTTTITGLAYSDVKIVGGPITGGATTGSFAGGTVLPSDEGKVRGLGIFLANFDYGRGFSTFVQADVRGGSGLLGAGGRVGARMQF